MKKYIVVTSNYVINVTKDNEWWLQGNNPTVFDLYKDARNVVKRVKRKHPLYTIRVIGIDVPVEIEEKVVIKYKSSKLTIEQKVDIMKTVIMSLVNNENLMYNETNIENFYNLAINKLEK